MRYFVRGVGIYCVAMLAAYSHAANAASVTLTVGTQTFSTTITTANAARLTAWATAMYGTNADGTTNPFPAISALGAVWSGIQTNVRNYERDKAKAAVVDPTPLD